MSKIIDADAVKQYVVNSFLDGVTNNNNNDYTSVFHSHVYARTCLNLLQKCRITSEIARIIVKFYFMYDKEPCAAAIILDRSNKIKTIYKFAKGYKAYLSEFINELTSLCKQNKSKKFIVIYNYDFRTSFYNELLHLDKLYNGLSDKKIILVDAIKISNNNIVSMISPYNHNKGYK